MSVCYFTYSWVKDEKKAEILDLLLAYIKDQIERLSDGNITVIYDKECFTPGDNFRNREKQLKESDSVLLFFTPEYKTKVEAREDNGVYREYEILKERANSELNGVIPILLWGSRDTSVTEEFKDIIYWDLSKNYYQINKSQGKTNLSEALYGMINGIVRKAIKETYAVSYCKSHVFQSLEDEYNALFLDSNKSPLPTDCIIRTTAYDDIIAQRACVVIGRKGSGKSTLLDAIQKYNPDFFYNSYKKLLALTVDSIDLNFVYDSLISVSRKEFNYIPMIDVIDTFWELVFTLQGMVIIGHELAEFSIEQEDKRYPVFRKVTDKLTGLLGLPKGRLYSELGHRGVCHCAVELLANHIKNENSMLANASEDTPLTAAYCSVNAYSILINTFGKQLFRQYCDGLKLCKKKILFALDGFDTHSDDFRTTTDRMRDSNPEEYQFRKDYEIRLFRELMMLVSNMKKAAHPSDMQKFYDAMHFCVILPQERFDEIAMDDRDIAKRSYCSLNWDAHDLLEMLVKRLEHYYRIEPVKNMNLNERFYSIISQKMPNIPTDLSVLIDGYEMKFPLFTYLLRLSFWRPRDLIKNFAMIMKLSKDPEDISEFAESIIKKSLIKSCRNIVHDEFIHEYQNIYHNIKEILYRFKGMDLIIDYDEFIEMLSKIPVRVSTNKTFNNTDEKLLLLYRLGVIGLYYNKEFAESRYGYHICFSFNEGIEPIEDFISYERNNIRAKIIFNPIFVKELGLNYNTKELVCNYSWDYIFTNHKLKDCIRRV